MKQTPVFRKQASLQILEFYATVLVKNYILIALDGTSCFVMQT